jgi:hypothetical protein
VDHCSIHHNRVIGLGYGVSVASGARVRVTDNQFFDCRHMLASNGAGNSGWTGRKTHWEFVHNRVYNQNRNANQQAAVDAHPGFDGTFLVEANSFENHDAAVDILGSSGRIQRNHFRNLGTGVSVRLRYSGGVPGAPHDIAIEGTASPLRSSRATRSKPANGSPWTEPRCAPTGRAPRHGLSRDTLLARFSGPRRGARTPLPSGLRRRQPPFHIRSAGRCNGGRGTALVPTSPRRCCHTPPGTRRGRRAAGS